MSDIRAASRPDPGDSDAVPTGATDRVRAAGVGLALAGVGVALVRRADAEVLALPVGGASILYGVAGLLRPGGEPVRWSDAGAALAGVGTILWPDLALRAAGLVVGMVLVALGSLRATTGVVAGPGRPRARSIGWGLSSVALGGVLLRSSVAASPMVAVLLGVVALLAGVGRLRDAAGPPGPAAGPPGR